MNFPAFLRHKVKMITDHAGPDIISRDRAELIPRYERVIAKLLDEKAPKNHWRDIEHDLDVMMRATVNATERKLIVAELTQKFGRASIGDSDEAIAKRVLKRGSIVGEEGQAVRDILSDLPEEVFTPAEETKLSAIFAEWERGS